MEAIPITYLHSDGVIKYRPELDVEIRNGWRTQCDLEKPAALGPQEYHKLECVGTSKRTTSKSGASFEFTFYGSSAQVYGAVHGSSFNVQLDGLPGGRYSAALDSNAGILTELVGLSPGKHVALVTLEDGNGQLDFSRVVFDAGIRSDWTNVTMDTRKDSPGWSFMSWDSLRHPYHNIDGSETSRSQEGVYTRRAGAKAEFTFFGSAIYLFGNFLFDHGRYTVSLDAEPAAEFNGSANYTITEGLVYFAAGLDASKQHKMTITNTEDQALDIIYTRVVSDPTPKGSSTDSATFTGTTTSGTLLPSDTSISASHSINNAQIVGASLGGVFAVCAIVLIFLVLRRRRQRWQSVQRDEPLSRHSEATAVRFVSFDAESSRRRGGFEDHIRPIALGLSISTIDPNPIVLVGDLKKRGMQPQNSQPPAYSQ